MCCFIYINIFQNTDCTQCTQDDSAQGSPSAVFPGSGVQPPLPQPWPAVHPVRLVSAVVQHHELLSLSSISSFSFFIGITMIRLPWYPVPCPDNGVLRDLPDWWGESCLWTSKWPQPSTISGTRVGHGHWTMAQLLCRMQLTKMRWLLPKQVSLTLGWSSVAFALRLLKERKVKTSWPYFGVKLSCVCLMFA